MPWEKDMPTDWIGGWVVVFTVLLWHCCVGIPFVAAEGEYMTYNWQVYIDNNSSLVTTMKAGSKGFNSDVATDISLAAS